MQRILVGSIVLILATSAVAPCGERRVRRCAGVRASSPTSIARSDVVLKSGLVVTPFAVPVAVPVAVLARPTVFYAYSQYAPCPPCERPAPVAAAAAQKSSIVARTCLACHAGQRPQAGLSLADLAALSPEQRLEAIARVVSDDPRRRMPQGTTLTPSEIGQLLQELAGQSDE